MEKFMKKISENLIKPMEDADILKGRINRKLIQNIFFYRYRQTFKNEWIYSLYV